MDALQTQPARQKVLAPSVCSKKKKRKRERKKKKREKLTINECRASGA
jgi:hypothetical protein